MKNLLKGILLIAALLYSLDTFSRQVPPDYMKVLESLSSQLGGINEVQKALPMSCGLVMMGHSDDSEIVCRRTEYSVVLFYYSGHGDLGNFGQELPSYQIRLDKNGGDGCFKTIEQAVNTQKYFRDLGVCRP